MDVDAVTIREIDYDAERTKLVVRLESGERYVYVGVPDNVGRAFVEADAKDRFFRLQIRGRYPFNRLEA